jgi:enoyl-CoA hydratase/carnithine racemase
VLLGEPIDTQRALQIGLISQVIPAKLLTKEAESLVKRILGLDAGAARRCKEFFQAAGQNSFDQNCRLAIEALTVGSLTALARKT